LNNFRFLVNCTGCLEEKYPNPAYFGFTNVKLSNLKAAKNKDIESILSFTLRRKLSQVQPDLLLYMFSLLLYTIMQFTNQKLVRNTHKANIAPTQSKLQVHHALKWLMQEVIIFMEGEDQQHVIK
jgi:hypothetical protein